MKIVNFETANGIRMGVVDGDNVVDVAAVDASLPNELGAFLRANGDMKKLAEVVKNAPASAKLPLNGLKFALPVANPGKIICLGLNYLDHVKEGPQKDNIPKFQSIFFRMLSSLTGHRQPLIRPKKSIQFDYEGELVVIIGKRAKHLTLENATDCVAGYTIGNEGSIREYQRHTTQWGMGKNFDQTGGVGPWMVTADELPRGAKGLKIETRLNGKTHAVVQHRPLHVPGGGVAGLPDRGHYAGAGRHFVHRHAVRRRPRPQARAGLDEGRRHRRGRDPRYRRLEQPDRRREVTVRGFQVVRPAVMSCKSGA